MSKNLVIVESPAKAKTISRFLGKDFDVTASMGHVRDLPKSKIGIDIENDFEPSYTISPDKKKTVKTLKDKLKDSDELWIATDEDREGEAIGWHLLHALKVDKEKTPVHRIVFHEITEDAIKKAIENPRDIDQNIVNAQKARRALDRLVGYELSPLMWKKVQPGLSAGRVQSVAVRLVVEREREILAFKPEEYWSIDALFDKDSHSFEASLQKHDGEKISISNEQEAADIENKLNGAAYKVSEVEEKQVKRNPAPPFITSTLQQEAYRKLGFSVKKTMMIAQQLYEGIDMGSGETGLITYMRTDSVNLSNLALTSAKKIIEEKFGKEYSLTEPRRYKGRKGAQEAHEAIRPVNLNLTPEQAAPSLNKDQSRLYELVWKRTLACQMAQAILNKVGVDIAAGETGYTFRATGQTIEFPGFLKVYQEGRDEGEEEDKEGILPKLEKGDEVDLKELTPNQHFTQPPPRYTEASLVKKLESEGIGRPSTYAPTISTVMARGYIEKEGKALKPTDVAMIVTDLLVGHFSNIVDYKFTADMETKLDNVEDGEEDWVKMLREFYEPFHKLIEIKNEELQKGDVLAKKSLGEDPKTGLEILVRHGRFGSYLQLGEWSEEDRKNKVNAPKRVSIPKGISAEAITFDEALQLLAFPRELGDYNGEKVTVNQGPYGPYIKVGKKNYSLPETYNPLTINTDEVGPVIEEAEKKKKEMAKPIAELGADPESGGEILIKNGRFGPYVTDGKTNASLGKKDPTEITREQAIEILAKKRKAPKRKR